MVHLPSTLLQILGLWQQREQHTAAPTGFPQYQRLDFCLTFRKGEDKRESQKYPVTGAHSFSTEKKNCMILSIIFISYSYAFIRAGLRTRIQTDPDPGVKIAHKF